MTPLNFPEFSLSLSKDDQGRILVFDIVRKKQLVLTPEEWVRQHFLHFLIESGGYPKSNISIEKGLKLNGLQKRCDILAYHQGEPFLLVECKAPHIKLDQVVFDQIARYNHVLKVPFLAVTNGLQHIYAIMDFENNQYKFIKDLPQYP